MLSLLTYSKHRLIKLNAPRCEFMQSLKREKQQLLDGCVKRLLTTHAWYQLQRSFWFKY